MKSLLTALQDGRLIELPDLDKEKSLEYLATLIEAIPEIGGEGGITESIIAREGAQNTAIGKGWACPHARSEIDCELLCSVGWSPKGIDYGAADGQPVHLVVMYFVPSGQKNSYLKEISSLARAIESMPSMQALSVLSDLSEVRHCLLDAIHSAIELSAHDARARMIQLEVKQASVANQTPSLQTPISGDFQSQLVPVQLVHRPGHKLLALTQDPDLFARLEAAHSIVDALKMNGRAEHQGVSFLLRAYSTYHPDTVVYDCLAVMPPPTSN